MATSDLQPIDFNMLDGGGDLKIRASCDACNRSKVRCSQAKPTCVRCERQGIRCIYGLSRRSHKTAPRIGESQTSAIPTSSSGSTARSSSELDSSHGSFANDMANEVDWINMATNADLEMANLPWNNVLDDHDHDGLYSPHTIPGGGHIRTDSLVSHEDSLLLSTSGILDQVSSSLTDNSIFDDETMVNGEVDRALQAVGKRCTCGSRNVQTVSQGILAPGQDQNFNTQLARLKSNARLLQQTLCCSCVFHDQTVILSISVFLGRMIQDFEVIALDFQQSLASNASSSAVSAQDQQSMQALTSECSTFKNVQIDIQEAQALKLHLWQLQFQKLEEVLSALETAIRCLKQTQGNDYAHIMACESLQSWLLQRANSARGKIERRG